ncbi:MAG: hypothetical protein QM784_15415 [Polyangiaceae bacterium]
MRLTRAVFVLSLSGMGIFPDAELLAQTEKTDRPSAAASSQKTPSEPTPTRRDGGTSSARLAAPATTKGVSRHRKLLSSAKHSDRPLAQAPTFEMRADGTSVVRLVLSKSAEVNVRNAKGKARSERLELALKDVYVGVKNNTNPLVTEHFPTPLRRVVLRRDGTGAVLVLELRENVPVQHSTTAGPGGAMIIELSLPRPTRAYSVPPARSSDKVSSRSGVTSRSAEGPKSRSSLDGPPGPRP